MAKEIQSRYYNGEEPYEPQSKTGKVLYKVGEFAPSAAVGPGGMVAKTLATVGGGRRLRSSAATLRKTCLGKSARPYGEFAGGFAGAMSPTALCPYRHAIAGLRGAAAAG
jgi:hypothetical protein